MKLQLYILRELALAFLFAVAGMFTLALPVVAIAAVSKLPGVATLEVLRFLPLLLAGLAPYVLPLGFLLAVVATCGRLAADDEWTAMRMTGGNPAWLFVPALGFALALGALNYRFASDSLPRIRRQQASFAAQALKAALADIPAGTTEFGFGRFYLMAERREGDEFIDAFIQIPGQDGGASRQLMAERVRFRPEGEALVVLLTHARLLLGDADVQSEHSEFRFDLDELAHDARKSYPSLRYLSSDEIAREIETGGWPAAKRHALQYELHARRAISCTYLMFLLLGAPTGFLLRRGTQLGALSVAVAYALGYYLLSMRLGKELAASSVIPAASGAWCVVVAGSLAGALLCWKALRR